MACTGSVPSLQYIRDGGGIDQAGSTAKETFYLMTVALEQPVLEFVK